MRFFEIVVSGAALISSVFAVTIDTYPDGIEAGKTYTLTYSPKDQPATFVLRKGLSTDLQTVATIGTGTGGSFTWTVPSSLPDAPNYAFMVTQGTEINYSRQFALTGGSAAVSSAASSASAAVSSAASSASAAASSAASAASSARASASAAISSIKSAAASATVSPSAGLNSTISSATLSRSSTPSGTSRPSSTSGGPPESTGAASMLESSPLAIIFGAMAAFAYLN